MNTIISILAGFGLAAIGGELFIRGAVGMARWAHIPARIIGVTIAAFATSSPELSVALNAAAENTPQITLGAALGSNIVNVGLILGLALLIGGIRAERKAINRDFAVVLFIPVLVGLLSLDGQLSRADGLIMLAIFAIWLLETVREALHIRNNTERVETEAHLLPLLALLGIGLGLLLASGRLIVDGANALAPILGLSEFVIGATLVAVGTGTPELAATVIAKLRGHDEVGLGNIMGSNIFNVLFIVALVAVLVPIQIHARELVLELVFGVITILLTYPSRNVRLGRGRGALLLATYVIYVILILVAARAVPT